MRRYPSKSNLSLSLVRRQQKSSPVVDGASNDSDSGGSTLPLLAWTETGVQPSQEEKSQLLWELMSSYIGTDVPTIQRQISDHVEYTLARDRSNLDIRGTYQATAYSLHDRLIEYWNDTNFRLLESNPKQVCYMSIEYLLGRSLRNNLVNLNIEDRYTEALKGLGYALEDLYDAEMDAGPSRLL